jgi:hypothetical protein
MSMSGFTESVAGQAALARLESLAYAKRSCVTAEPS